MLISGNTSENVVKTLLVDSSGRTIVVPPFSNNWDVIKAAYGASLSNLDLAAGQNIISLPVTPANTFRKVTVVTVTYAGTVTGVAMSVWAVIGGVGVAVGIVLVVVSWQAYVFLVDITLAPGDHMRVVIGGATLNDKGYIYAAGYDIATA